ncbi:MAG: acyl-ACP desaturase [Acidimicrobiales bacterium]
MSSQAEAMDLVGSVDNDIRKLIDNHIERREHWYAHDIVPWEMGRNFRDEPWDESQCTLSPEVRNALVVNLLTEDNLPYYHAQFRVFCEEDSPLTEWSGMWTGEEGQHAIAIRNYLLTSRNCDPNLLEDDRLVTVKRGWFGAMDTAIDLFNYTAAQELATRISHRNAGVKADCPVAKEVMTTVAADENHHFIFYRGVVTAMLAQAPDLVLPSMAKVMEGFEMPGTGIPRFKRRAIAMARLGIYNLRIHTEQVVAPLLKYWNVEGLTGLSSVGAQAQETLMALPAALLEQAERFEARIDRSPRLAGSQA